MTIKDYSQNDPRWKNTRLGFSSWETIGRYGCLVDSFAEVATAQGSPMTPKEVNDSLKAHHLFVRDSYGQTADIAGYHALGVIAKHSEFVEQMNWPGTVVAPYKYFDVRSSVNTEIIIKLDYHPDRAGVQSHYCRVIGLNSKRDDIEIVDSWDGRRKWLSAIAKAGGKKADQIIWTAGKYKKV